MLTQRRLVSPEALEVIADAYAVPESGYRRTASGIKASYDGALILLGLVDEIRELRALLERVASDAKKVPAA